LVTYCHSAAAVGIEVSGRPTLRLVQGDGAQTISDAPVADEPVAEVRGINLYGRWKRTTVHPGLMVG
jgi:hypothetical protein